jgi:hypothetical protein
MHYFEIDGKEYSGTETWEEMSLKRFIELSKIEIPAKFSAMYTAKDDDAYKEAAAQITYEDTIKYFPEFFGKVIALLTNIPSEILDFIDYESRSYIYFTGFHHFIMSVLNQMPYIFKDHKLVAIEPVQKDSFWFDGEEYFFPKSLRLSGLETPMAFESVVTFIESSDLMLSWKKMSEAHEQSISMIIAIYCRKDGERYDEQLAIQRSEKFTKIPMSVVWQVFFCITQQLISSIRGTLLSTRDRGRGRKRVAGKTSIRLAAGR